MKMQLNQSCSTFFGSGQKYSASPKSEIFKKICDDFRIDHQLNHVIFLHQTHSANGKIITPTTPLFKPTIVKEEEGDFLITTAKNIGLGITTADCLPIIFYDPQLHIIGAAHAGWRGSCAGISAAVINHFKTLGSDPKNIKVYFGAAAQDCCYEVQADFLKPENASFVTTRNSKKFFDNSSLNTLHLINAGISEKNIDLTNHACTICNDQYQSYRRATDKVNYNAQITVIWQY